jgi:5-carboxymethyl-2-hydroxymuconate isomerase
MLSDFAPAGRDVYSPTSHHQGRRFVGAQQLLSLAGWKHIRCLRSEQYLICKPADRAKYIEAFFSNIDGRAVEERPTGRMPAYRCRVENAAD